MRAVNTQDVVSIFLIILLVIVTVCITFVSYFFVQALKSITRMADNIEETTEDIKRKLQMKALAAIPAILVSLASRVIKRKRG